MRSFSTMALATLTRLANQLATAPFVFGPDNELEPVSHF